MTASRTVKFETAVSRGLAAIKGQTKMQWTIGDLASQVDTSKYGAKTVQAFAEAIDMPYKTVMDLRKVAERYAAGDRSDLNNWSIHQVFAGQDDRAELIKRERWTVKSARAYLASLNGNDDNAGSDNGSDDNGSDTPADPRAKLVANVDRLRAELDKAEAALAAYDAEHAAPAADKPAKGARKPAAAKADRHVGIRGIPAHDATDPRTDCPKCIALARVNGTEVTPRHARQTNRKPTAAKAA